MIFRIYIQILFVFLSGLILFGCGARIKKAIERTPISIPAMEKTRPVQFRKIIVKMRRGTSIGSWQAGLLCVHQGNLVWRGGRVNVTSDDFTEVFHEELKKNNYSIVGDPNALFDDPSAWKAEFLIAGMIKIIQANVCYPMGGFGNFNSSKGEAYLKVDW